MTALNVNLHNLRYRAMIGTGGIGSGMFFALNGDHTLGREESRSGRFLEQRDYCKLHIIAHYVKVLLGKDFPAILLGRVGEDDLGGRLLREMSETGLDVRHVLVTPGAQTLSSLCFLYPDGSGGNLTMDDSACNHVDAAQIAGVENEFARFSGQGVALAAPEVPLPARHELLRLATNYGFLRAASFTSGEIVEAIQMGLLGMLDLLSINLDEASALLGWHAEEKPVEDILQPALSRLRELNPSLLVCITAGKLGSWSWDGKELRHLPALPAHPVSTAGAGDAFLAGLIVGLSANLSLPQAGELSTLVAALSVTSPHTIHPDLERDSLRTFVGQVGAQLSQPVQALIA